MAPISELNRLMAMVVSEPDLNKVLDQLTYAALRFTPSRNVMIAEMDEELGCLELRRGAGKDWKDSLVGEQLFLQINKKDGIVAYVAATGETYRTGDVREEPRYHVLFDSTISEIAVPIHDRHNRIRGVFNLESDQPDAFKAVIMDTCEALARLAGIAIDRSDLRAREEALVEIGNALDSALTEDELIDKLIDVASNVLRFQAFSVFLYDRTTSEYLLKGSVGRLKDQVGKISYKKGEGCTGWVCETGQPVLLANPQSDVRWRGRYLEFPRDQIASFLAVPIVSRGRCVGAIRAIRRTTDNPFLENTFTPGDLRVLQSIAEQVATGLENIRNVEKMVHSERMIAWGELSAKSSHMIGNRVFALKGDINELSYMIKEGKTSLDQLLDIQLSLSANVLRIEEILQDFRDFVTATQLVLGPADLNAIVRETAEELFGKRSPVAVDLQLDDSLPTLQFDAKKLRRAVSELMENATNYMPEGVLKVRTGKAEPELLKKVRSGGGNMAKLEIVDSGPGVPAEIKNNIFQPFFSSRVKGMGLGLSIVKGIVDAHGGAVFEDGTPGEGARFVILLPMPKRLRKET